MPDGAPMRTGMRREHAAVAPPRESGGSPVSHALRCSGARGPRRRWSRYRRLTAHRPRGRESCLPVSIMPPPPLPRHGRWLLPSALSQHHWRSAVGIVNPGLWPPLQRTSAAHDDELKIILALLGSTRTRLPSLRPARSALAIATLYNLRSMICLGAARERGRAPSRLQRSAFTSVLYDTRLYTVQ